MSPDFDPEAIEHVSDVMDVARANALHATLGHDLKVEDGGILPPFFHQAYFWQPEPPSALGRDGHPKVGGIIPDLGLPRRMWAGGRLAFHTPLVAGVKATKVTRCETARQTTGRTGALAFVTLRHEVWQGDELCVMEWQDLVYRADPSPDAVRPQAPVARTDAQSAEGVGFDATQLFRYSALTFNGHRIHYDLPYARDIEGYDGLVVHGPLLAQLLMLKAQRELGDLATFSFRATAPLMDFEHAKLCRSGTDFWVSGPDDRQCMVASATAAS
ncbi:Mesaconyl-C(4)-CoA hydratase [Ascidiaceihabitans donghaensis]|uniref:Mesaconyl-C(4)-CoA hydratase n=2 Tax=Ascidiaceihabitans donghaensis TaxID=1510460 RepID=A0A2R8BII2_9RHOB|nr:Mesaconyl-C(4)-CoA hydratase [Ascidiaceihabitans donghaensis]